MKAPPEVWLRGPLPGIAAPLQPVAHALLQAVEDVDRCMEGFPDHLLWSRPAGVASVGFHLQHLAGVLDRLFAYARGEALDEKQTAALRAEGAPPASGIRSAELVERFRFQVELALRELQSVDSGMLMERRSVGRAGLPSTVLGLLFHAAEHVQRHVGQLLVTVRVQTTGADAAPEEAGRRR